jgi:hypothetical protein
MTGSGKIQKFALRDRHLHRPNRTRPELMAGAELNRAYPVVTPT